MNEIALRLAARLFDQPLIMNTYRGTFIEAMLEPYLAQSGWRHTGDYGGWDFEHDCGAKLKNKQAAALQTWDKLAPAPPLLRERPSIQPSKHRQLRFDIRARTGSWDPFSHWTANPGRQAELYVFAYHGQVHAAADQRRPDQWEFFIVTTAELDAKLPTHRSVGLTWLRNQQYHSVIGPERCAEQVSAWLLQRAPQP